MIHQPLVLDHFEPLPQLRYDGETPGDRLLILVCASDCIFAQLDGLDKLALGNQPLDLSQVLLVPAQVLADDPLRCLE